MNKLFVIGVIVLLLLVGSVSTYYFCSPIDYSNKEFWDYSAQRGLFPIKDATGNY